MPSQIRTVKNAIQYLKDREDEVSDDVSARDWYNLAMQFLQDYVTEVQDDLEEYHNEKYAPAESYYYF